MFVCLFYFRAALGLHCRVKAFSSRGEWQLLFSCGTWAYKLHSVIPRAGIKLVSPEWQGRFVTTGPSVKPLEFISARGVRAYPASFVFSVAVQSRVMGWSAHTDHAGATVRRARSTAAFRVRNEGSVQAASTPSTSHRVTLAYLGGKPSPRCYPGPGELLPLLTAVAPARLSTNTTTVSQDEG